MTKTKILVVEDEAIIALHLQRMLEELGYEVPAPCSSGEAAIVLTAKFQPDLVLMDIGLKGEIDGLQAAEHIREQLDIPVVYITGHSEETLFQEARITRPYGYLIKPINGRALRPNIEMALDRHKVEQALRESEERFDLVVRATNDGIWDWNIVTNEEYYSPRWCEILGYSHDDPDLQHVYDSWASRIHPDDYEHVMNAIKGHLEDGKVYNVDYRHRHKSGEYRWQNSRGQAIFDENGEPIRMVGCIRDITERVRAEEALAEKTHMLGERVKELNCLYGMSKLLETPGISLEDLSQGTVDLIPPSWQYPEVTCARLTLEDQEFKTGNFKKTTWRQASDIFVHREKVGELEVCYLEKRPDSDEGPFLKEERDLINAIAEYLGRITERKRAEEQIKASLREKEVLLKEIHHRVKNNMQVISSLLNLQAMRTKDERVRELLKDSRSRVHSMALVHEKLYQSPNLAQVDFSEYVRGLTRQLISLYQVDQADIRLVVDVKDVSLVIDTAIPCGLIINELISNSLKYAFPGDRSGMVSVELRQTGEEVTLVVSDNGVGIPGDIDWQNTDSLGLQLVSMLTGQLDGEIKLDRTDGTSFKITFPNS